MKIYKKENLDIKSEEKGFITIATGSEKYYKMAYTLLASYRAKSSDPMRFCVITDKENEWTEAFDDIIIVSDAKKSYVDKIDLMINSPYRESIFIDADCIAYDDLNKYWNFFEESSDISAFGEKLPLNQGGWFPDTNKIGKYRDRVTYGINLHGGIYYLRRGATLNKVYCDCQDIMKEYDQFLFKDFAKPADEPIIALAMAINNCKPTADNYNHFIWLKRANKLKAEFFSGRLEYCHNNKVITNVPLLHFGTSRTIMPVYLIESSKVHFWNEKGHQMNLFETMWNYITGYSLGFALMTKYAWKLLNKRKNI